MAYSLDSTPQFDKYFKKLDKQSQENIANYIRKKLVNIENPRSIGKPLKGNLQGLWRYRIGDYRLICQIQDQKLIILAVEIAHRKEVYKGK
ncbi:MAG: type II toxin-antitoxin system RelE/ParE family toxin [Tannerella sp.]|jgi:mRNA interferase RelE/StbE|nr:type II toxin-antitoxin system RelE/ParE family toxin [Tannerella sp.]